MDDDRHPGRPGRGLGRIQLCHRGFPARRPALVLQPGRPIHQHSGRLNFDRHVRQRSLNHPEIPDRLPELPAVAGELDTGIQAGLGHPQRPGRYS